ncbi:Bud-site selection protein [Paxillus ammoniavirescens]|nr:Bud-site selection protein [Paxillus ammoniavirescens]
MIANILLQEDGENKLCRKLHHDVKEVRKAAKKARTFEIQKTLKKLKDARRKDPAGEVTKDLEAQLETLKRINYDQVANSALMTKLKKDKVLSADPSTQSAISTELASNLLVLGTPGTATAKAQNRMLSSKALASEVMSVVEILRNLVHPHTVLEEPGEPDDRPYENSQARDVVPNTDSDEETSSEASDEKDDDAERAVVDDDGWESGTVSGGEASATGDRESGSANDCYPNSGEEDSDDVVINPDAGDDDDFPSNGLKRRKSQPITSTGQSEFLPSLSVGFARGNSDSEFSDSEAKLADGAKKNRRGQRARRAIWEKKFGKNANHVKQRETVQGLKRALPRPNTAPADRRSLVTKASAQHSFQSRPPGYGHERGFGQCTQSQSVPQNTPRSNPRSSKGGASQARIGHQGAKRDEQPLHPSWEAKRKQKSASIVSSQGTKIVFSES